ncbi:MAG TPA: hypothetical protein PLN52_16085 [Opitutaceae bacterium]|nr:hypothetical protein [Opitutaceae bacterium]
MGLSSSSFSPRIAACECLTAFGDTHATLSGLLADRCALTLTPVLGRAGGDLVPVALVEGRGYEETLPPEWMKHLAQLAERLPHRDWGTSRRPVMVTSSNFGVGALHAFRGTGNIAYLAHGTPFACVEAVSRHLGWGPQVTTFSHACVSAHLGLLHASRLLAADLADEVLVFSFDFLSPFVVGGFHALKILNSERPAPYQDRATGSVGLGDGAAYAVLTRDRGDFLLAGQRLYNEMHHFTANRPDGAGFEACLGAMEDVTRGRRVWVKGHGTGTLEAGRLESTLLARAYPDSPLISWKGSLGHTLGSCGLVELAIALAAIRGGRIPGTVGSTSPAFAPTVALTSFPAAGYDSVLCTSNAFGGAHAALLACHA